jgi:hypothetical protein
LLAAAHPLDNWHLRYTAPSGLGFHSVAASDTLFVAVGGPGLIVTSSDGTNWANQASGVLATLAAVAHGAGMFVTVGEGGTILSSPDGTNWTLRASGTTAWLQRVRFGNGLFLAAGQAGTLLTSTDGSTWAAQNPGAGFTSYFIAHGNGLFLLAGSGHTNLVSPDGTNWFPRPAGTANGLYTAGGGHGVFLSIDTRNQVFTSADASNWTQRGSVTVTRPSELAYGNGYWVCDGNGGPEYSENGAQWTAAATNLFAGSVVFGQGTFVLTAGLSIWQSDPVVRLSAIGLGTLALEGPVGRTYNIESQDVLNAAANWELRTNVTLTTSPTMWSDPAPPPTHRFYRAVLSP